MQYEKKTKYKHVNTNESTHQFLPKWRNCPYNLWDRTHDRELIQKETGLEKEFV